MRSNRALILFLLFAGLAAGGTVSAAAGGCVPLLDCSPSGPPKVRVADSLTTVRLDQPVPAGLGSEASLIAARNEFESFQVVVEAGSELGGVEVVPGEPLRGPGGAVIPARNLSIYREVPYEVETPSDSEGAPGLWPDALIPAKDYLYGERRRAFPVDVPAGGRLVAWIDVFVAPGQRSGTYRGSVLVRDSTGSLARVAVAVRVLGFSLPSTSRLASAFGFDWQRVCTAHTGESDCGGNPKLRWQLASLYVRAGLQNRITLSIPVPTDNDEPPRTARQRRLFARYAVPLLDGRGRDRRLRGARLTTMSISWNCLDDGDCLTTWTRLARRHRFGDRLSLYLCDEPHADPEVWRECRRDAARADRQSPAVPKLVTTTIQEARQVGGGPGGAGPFLGQIDILAPVVNDLAGPPGTDLAGDQRPRYDAFLASRRDGVRNALWFYTSCRSFGCEAAAGDAPLTAGVPGYAIDEPASQARAAGWLAFLYRVSGELYYQTTARLPRAWIDQYLSGGNGDGTLFYPGVPRGTGGGPAIGGRHPIPIESIRLKRIRDGREDYEYLKVLAARGQRGAATTVVRGLFGPPSIAMHNATVSPVALSEARSSLAALISGRSALRP